MDGDITTIEEQQLAALQENRRDITEAPQEQRLQAREKPAINTAEAAVAIALALFCDALQFGLAYVPFAGQVANSALSIVIGFFFYLWVKMRGLNVPGGKFLKKWGTWLVGGVTGLDTFIPIIQGIAPTWTILTLIVIFMDRIQTALKQLVKSAVKVLKHIV